MFVKNYYQEKRAKDFLLNSPSDEKHKNSLGPRKEMTDKIKLNYGGKSVLWKQKPVAQTKFKNTGA